ncbi:MAG TPA: cobalamin-independent methionine synthase II family protein [Rhizomicrobium sp.]|jgi:5-methyltetrahydropteroyltriglutamate--homocysteine methyltransferase
MHRSTDRILTTHVGSLPRAPALTELLVRQERGEPVDRETLHTAMRDSVNDVVAKQVAAGIDIVNDGEQPRVGFQTYVPLRMKGFGGESQRKPPTDMMAFPDMFAVMARRFPSSGRISNAPQAVADVRYEDLSAAKEELDLFDDATAGLTVADRFMTAPSPGIIATTMLNAHYDSHEAYVFALAREMKKEYALIAARGLVLQIDSPDLAMERTMQWQDKSLAEFLDIARMHVAALNEAIADIPREQVRLHCCWGNWEGPHIHDVPLADILPVLYGAHVGALSLEFANPRHQHELTAFKTHPFPDDRILIPGVLDSTTNYVEHPQVVANRIVAAAEAVGDRTRVIAGTDCGFGTFAGYEFIAPSIVWAKLRALADGAALASGRLTR